MDPLDSLQKDLMRFEKLAEHQHAHHHAVHAAHDHGHRRRETWWLAADGSHGHPGSSETLHKCPQVILGPMPTSLAPTATSNLPKVAHLHDLGHDHHVGSLPQGGRSQRSGQRGICSHFAAIVSFHDLSCVCHGPRRVEADGALFGRGAESIRCEKCTPTRFCLPTQYAVCVRRPIAVVPLMDCAPPTGHPFELRRRIDGVRSQ